MTESGFVSLLPSVGSDRLPMLFEAMSEGGRRFWELSTVNVRKPHTRRAYFKAVESFAGWCRGKRRHQHHHLPSERRQTGDRAAHGWP